MKIIVLIIGCSFLFSQFPVDLNPDEITEPFNLFVESDTEFILTISASTNTDWSIMNGESSTLVVIVDGESDNYNQDVVLYAGQYIHNYNCSLGHLENGDHTIEFIFDSEKSSILAEWIHIESIELTDISTLLIDEDAFRFSPILYGRDLLSWNESTHTDIPLIMWHDISLEGVNKRITYSIIFSNEDSRVGLGLADLMYSYGRTTDIEWVYEVVLSDSGDIVSEVFQGPSHTTTNFQGNKVGQHPILKNATLNCNFIDTGSSDYKFFLSPIITSDPNFTRQILMDENPWTYRIMGEELANEERYEANSNPQTVEISDVRNYIYIEYNGNSVGNNIEFGIVLLLMADCAQYVHHHNSEAFSQLYAGGMHRTSIELPENFNPALIDQLGFITDGNEYNVSINDISRLFYLDNNYNLIDINTDFVPFVLSDNNTSYWMSVNENVEDLDCFGVSGGMASCDDCRVCDGSNMNMDDCNVCFGNNMDMDCNGVCFGPSEEDDCGICDDNAYNDNSLCSGCTDINAENYDENAIFDDDSCIYSYNIFYVPADYSSIQSAINYAHNGDTIEVAPGTYYENINFLSKALVVRSEYMNGVDIDEFIISGSDSLSVVTIENVEQDGAALMGFTISEGYGGGVSFEDFISMAADEILFDSLITNVIRGGGISVINSSPLLKDLYITNNTSRNVGAGIGLVNSNAIVQSTIISNNDVPDGDALGGGGIAINGGHPYLSDLEISYNTVGQNMYYLNGGGGIFCGFSFGDEILQVNIENSIIEHNTANIGAGIGALSGIININRLLLAENLGDFGSAISMGEPLGLVVGDIEMSIANSTISSNIGQMSIAMINSANLNAVNTILWENAGVEFSSLPNNDQLNISITHSIVGNDWGSESNLFLDPLFMDQENGDYTLQESSPCIDMGTADIDGDGVDDIADFIGLAPDMGAYEFGISSEIIAGDTNFDGIVDILDIVRIVNYIMGNLEFNDAEFIAADYNNDDIIDILDIVQIVNYILEN